MRCEPPALAAATAWSQPHAALLQVTVIALHHDDPEGMYATIRLPDGRERHTEASRLLPPGAAAGAPAESAGW